MTDGGEASALDVGESVVDRDATDPNTAVVVALPDTPAYDYTLDALDGGPSVADLNPEYAASGPVATVAFAGELDDALDVWREADPEALAELCESESVRTYTYPVERLREVSDE